MSLSDLFLLLWVLVLFIFAILEFTKLHGDFTSFAIGGACALLCWLVGFDWIIQFVAFAVATVLSLIFLRPLIKRFLEKRRAQEALDANEHIGHIAVVTQKIDYAADTGRVIVDGFDSLAVAENPKMKYNVADKVTVVGGDGMKLIVSK